MPYFDRSRVSRRTVLALAGPAGIAGVLRHGGWLHPATDAAAQGGTPVPIETKPFPGKAVPQPSYETLRLEEGGLVVPYHVFIDWLPAMVTTPDGGGWIFFGAQARATERIGQRRLYAARFDPVRAVWLPATAMPGSLAQFGPAAAVDSAGTVHVVYSDVTERQDAASTLVHTRWTDAGWAEPTPVAPDPNAGLQMMADIAIDGADGVHVLWRDQRTASAEERGTHPAYGALFTSDLVNGSWTAPREVMSRENQSSVAGWPHLAADGDRLVAVWSIYDGIGEDDMKSAKRIEWASRGASDGPWDAPAPLLERPAPREIGGRLVDVAADPTGGVVVVYGSYERARNELAFRRLDPGASAWTEARVIGDGDFGYLPAAGVRGDGALFVVFNAGRNRNVEVGALAVDGEGQVATPVTLTPAEDGLQARAVVAVGADGSPWVVYMHQPPGASAVPELRVVREANLLGAGAA